MSVGMGIEEENGSRGRKWSIRDEIDGGKRKRQRRSSEDVNEE
jgi:hypothetical protein